MTTCATCQASLTQPATGRPRVFCSVPCRRVAESEVRRIERRLEQLDDYLTTAGRTAWAFTPRQHEADMAHTRRQIEDAVARQRELFARLAPDGDTP